MKFNSQYAFLLGHLITFVVLFTFLKTVYSGQIDDTMADYAMGHEVTDAVIRKILRSNIFSEDYGFLFRMAYVESKFGTHSQTFKEGYFGGIWQVDQWKLKKTQNLGNETLFSIILPIHEKIKNYFDIDWISVQWEDLLKPLYSGLAARFFIEINSTLHGMKIPDNINRQANFWEMYYTFGHEFEQAAKFRQESHILQDTLKSPCRTKMDLVIGIDGSSSVGEENFANLVKHLSFLLEQTFDKDSLRNTQIGAFIYSTLVYRLFGLENDLSLDKMRNILESALFPFGDTRLDIAMLYGAHMLKNETFRSKTGVPQVLLLFQEGQSGIFGVKEAASLLSGNIIKTIVVGIGNDVNVTELIEVGLNDTKSVFTVEGFGSLSDFFIRLKPVICSIPQKPLYFGYLYNDTLAFQEQRYFVVDIPNSYGITIIIDVDLGSVKAYWSYTDEVPSKFVHDEEIDGITYIPAFTYRKMASRGKILIEKPLVEEEYETFPQTAYVTIEGIEATNVYHVYIVEGNQDTDNVSEASFIEIHFLIYLLYYFLGSFITSIVY